MLTSNLKTVLIKHVLVTRSPYLYFISHFNENTEPGDPFPSDKHCNGIGKLW